MFEVCSGRSEKVAESYLWLVYSEDSLREAFLYLRYWKETARVPFICPKQLNTSTFLYLSFLFLRYFLFEVSLSST